MWKPEKGRKQEQINHGTHGKTRKKQREDKRYEFHHRRHCRLRLDWLPDGKEVWALWTHKPNGPLGLGVLDVPEVNLPVSGTIERVADLYGHESPPPPTGLARITPTQDTMFITVTPRLGR